MWGLVATTGVVGLLTFVLLNHQNDNAIANRETVCIDGVKYYMIREYQKGFMAPAYDPTTLQVKTCR